MAIYGYPGCALDAVQVGPFVVFYGICQVKHASIVRHRRVNGNVVNVVGILRLAYQTVESWIFAGADAAF